MLDRIKDKEIRITGTNFLRVSDRHLADTFRLLLIDECGKELDALTKIKRFGYDLMIVGTQDSDIAKGQLQTGMNAEMYLGAYVWLDWTGNVADQVKRAIDIVSDYHVQWMALDVEQQLKTVIPTHRLSYTGHKLKVGVRIRAAMQKMKLTPANIISQLHQAVDACGDLPVVIYTGKWAWLQITLDSHEFSHIDLWDAWYPHDDINEFATYGGWYRCQIRQWHDTTTLAGISCDLNVYRRN